MKGLDALGRFLYRQGKRTKLFASGNRQVQRDLEQLHPGENGQELLENYYSKKIGRFLAICLVGILLGAVLTIRTHSSRELEAGGILRGEYTEGSRELELTAVLETGEKKNFSVAVEPRKLTGEEVQALYGDFAAALPDLVRQRNPSLQEITEDLLLEEHYTGFPFSLEWASSRPDIVAGSGKVFQVEEDTKVSLTAKISYGEQTWEEQFAVTVVPVVFTAEEEQDLELEGLLLASERDSRAEKVWNLPDSFQGRRLTWEQKSEDNGLLLMLGAVAAAVLIFLMEDKDLHDELLQKKAQMRRSYPTLVRKLALYMGAGLTIRGTFQRLSAEGQEHGEGLAGDKLVYEEIRHTCREMQTGTAEIESYERFGKRIGVQEYIRLSTLLIQNLKKGNVTLLQRLHEEAARAEAGKLQECRKLAEEASTKLLIPMVLFLAVVMIMIMLPAFSTMGA